MIGFLAPILARVVGARFAKAASWALIALAALAALYGAYSAAHHAGVKAERHRWELREAKIEAQLRKAEKEAAETATASKDKRDDEFRNQQEVIRNDADKKATDDPVGPGVASVIAGLRKAGRSGQ